MTARAGDTRRLARVSVRVRVTNSAGNRVTVVLTPVIGSITAVTG